MKQSTAYKQNPDAIRQIVERHHAKKPRVFGSVLHGQDTDEGDLDILIDTTVETFFSTLALSAQSLVNSSE